MAIENLIGAYTQLNTAFNKSEGEASLQKFYQKISEYGTIVRSRYEVSFSGIDNLTFFITDINIPSIKMNNTQVYYEGQMVEVPQNYEFDHDFTMTVLCDGKGILYSTIQNWLMTVGGDSLLNSGYTMTIRSLGDGVNTDGMTIVLNGVRFRNISGLTYSNTDSSLITFLVGCTAINYTVTQGKFQKVSGILGALGTLGGFDANSIVQSIR